MSDRYTGGILSGTAPTVTQQSANGVYTLSQELQYQGQGVWPTASQNPILQSLRFRASASAYLSRTPASATNQKTWTYSAWVKRAETIQNDNRLFGAGTSDSNRMTIFIENWIGVVGTNSGSNVLVLNTTPIYRDPSAWYHVIVAVDTTQATSSNRVKVYVNGTQVTSFTTATYPSQNTDLYVNSTATHVIGTRGTYAVNSQFDGQMAEINFIDGVALTPSSFGTTDVNGIWQPIPYTGAYGTNGFYLPFSNKTSTTTLGYDFSGNSNNWTTNNISLTANSTYDSMLDSPSNANPNIANYAVLNPLDIPSSSTASNGNLTFYSTANATWKTICSTMAMSGSGKFYAEFAFQYGANAMYGIVGSDFKANVSDSRFWITTPSYGYYSSSGLYYNNTNAAYGASFTTGDIIGVAFDAGAGTLTFYKNGVSQGTAATAITGSFFFAGASYNSSGGEGFSVNFGQQPWLYSPPTGYFGLNTYNLPVPTIPAGSKFMDATLWAGNNATQSIVNSAGFQPDFVWLKNRTTAYSHLLYDSVRGVGTLKAIGSANTNAEGAMNDDATYGYLSALNSNGFTVVSGSTANSYTNSNSNNYVAWQWQAGQGVTSSNTNGTITSTVSVNTTAGFSVVTYTGNSTNPSTVGHGLGVAPQFIIIKCRSNAYNWVVGSKAIDGFSSGKQLYLNTTAALVSGENFFSNTQPTSTVFTIKDNYEVNFSGYTYVAYCFAPVAGYSAFGSYTGNGSADGAFIYTGFRPAFIMIKRTDSSGTDWVTMDYQRLGYNATDVALNPNAAYAENSGYATDFTANGFKLRTTTSFLNGSGATYIYMAFASSPFKIARAR